ncbi:MAG TPA: hypothetical protein GXX51_12165 [Firmicutes bacterium]|nr:hypothetical protein [Bacillota bacterium]
MRFGKPDRLPCMEWLGFWPETIDRWRNEGLPKYEIELFLGLDRFARVPFGVSSATNPLVPPFVDEFIREEGAFEIRRNQEGVIYRLFKGGTQTMMPQWLRYPISGREDFAEIRKRLNPDSVDRYPIDLQDFAQTIATRDYPIGVWAGSLFGWIRNWMGLEGISYALYDDLAFVEEMMEYITDFMEAILNKLLIQIGPVDFALFWEDMACKSGPLISPKHFRMLMVPRYERLTALLRRYGIDIILVDCDGDCEPLIDLWLEGGVTGIYPLEVAAGMDPVVLRKRYGKDLMMIGGIDKRALAKGRKEIEAEVIPKIEFLADAGGWIPSVDHLVPPDVPLKNYLYYLQLVREIGNRNRG